MGGNNNIHQAVTDGTIHATHISGTVLISVRVDTFTPPTTFRVQDYCPATNQAAGCAVDVAKGEYYQVIGAETVYWKPSEP